jgi:glycosyltransferase involved in cell wall biosynthesis
VRVIIATDEFVITGGAAKVALQCLEACVDKGLETAVLVGDSGKEVTTHFPQLKTIALNEVPLRDSQQVGDMLGKTFNLKAYNAMKALLEWGGPDVVVHVHGWSQILSPAIFYALAQHKARVLVTAHDFFLNCPNGGLINYKSGEICTTKPMSMACLTSNCDKRSYAHKLWRFNRQLAHNGVGDAFWSRVGVILVHENMEPYYAGSPLREFLTLRTPSEPLTRKKFNPWENRNTVFLGRMTWEKGVRTLSDALNLTQKSAILIGRGPLQAEIAARSWAICRMRKSAKSLVRPATSSCLRGCLNPMVWLPQRRS